MFLTLRFFSLVLALGATLQAGCSLEREGSADALRDDDDAPTAVAPGQRPEGQAASDASVPTAPVAEDGAARPLTPGLQTDAASADTPKPPSADVPDASATPPAATPPAPSTPPPQPAEPTRPAEPTQPAPSTPPPSTPPPSNPPPSNPPPSNPPPSNPPPSNPPPSNPPPSNPPPQPPAGFSLNSPLVPAGGELPLQYACDGASPPFSWSGAPGGVGSYALVLEQFDYGSLSNRLLWAMVNIPGNFSALPQGFATERVRFQAPICGGSQRYTYTLYALAQAPTFGNGVSSVTRTERLGGQVVFLPSGVLGTTSLVAYVNR